MKILKSIKSLALVLAALGVSLFVPLSAYAEEAKESGITVSPMHQMKVLTPGYAETGSFVVANPSTSERDVIFELEIRPFSYDDEEGEVFTKTEAYSDMVDWITLSETEGTLLPNEKKEIAFTINVPEDAPAGGQYAAIITKVKTAYAGPMGQAIELAHLIYAEVAGETRRSGDIDSVNVPSFLFSGNITGSSYIHNTGNTHSYATHILKVSPLFGGEEYFTNEEDPQSNLIMPGATRYTSIAWDKTPSIGIFRVQYTVEFEGLKKEVSKIVIVCPIWLLIIIALIVLILIYRIFFASKKK